jgi:hypothetical protein
MKRSQMKSHRWRDHRWRITDEDGMKDTDKNHDFNIFDTDN